MQKKFSFFTDYFTLMITFQSEFGMKKFKIYKLFIYALFIVFIGLFMFLSYVYYNYYQTRKLYTNYRELKKIFLQQNINYKENQEKLRSFSQQLQSFQIFDTKIRRITNKRQYNKANSIRQIFLDDQLQEKNFYSDLELQGRSINKQISNVKLAYKIRKGSFLELEVIIRDNLERLVRTPSFEPVNNARLTSGYGERKDPFDGSLQFHKGVDWSAPMYTPVIVAANGRIAYAYYEESYGNLMAVNHGYGMITRYAHLSKFEKKVGQIVKRGDIIARVGNSGKRTTGAHLHYEIMVNGKHINPLTYIINNDTVANINEK